MQPPLTNVSANDTKTNAMKKTSIDILPKYLGVVQFVADLSDLRSLFEACLQMKQVTT